MNPARRSENEVVRALLNDFYRSLYPIRSSFELPSQFRNRFTHRHDLLEWRENRARARNIMLGLILLLLTLTLYHAFKHKMRRICPIRTLPALFVWSSQVFHCIYPVVHNSFFRYSCCILFFFLIIIIYSCVLHVRNALKFICISFSTL